MGNMKSSILVCIFLLLKLPALLFASEPGDIRDVKWSFVVYSDNRGSNPTHREVLKSIARIKPDIILNLGDIVYQPEDYGAMSRFKEDVEECYGNFGEFLKIFHPSIGGHEERYYNHAKYPPHGKEPDNEAGRKFYGEVRLKERVAEFNDQYGDYYFSHKNVHFIVFYRSDQWEFRDGQIDWLKGILEKINVKGPVIVAGHAGGWFYPLSASQKQIVDLMKKHRVDIALAADWHDYYAAVNGDMMMFRSGSAGWGDGIFIRFDVTGRGFVIKALEPDGVTPFTKREDANGQIMHPCWMKEFGKPGRKVDCE